MKIITKEEEQAYYNATLKGGAIGGIVGLGIGVAGVYGASLRYPAFRGLTLPFRTFLAISSGTFASIVTADRFGRQYEEQRHPEKKYRDDQQSLAEQVEAQKSGQQQTMDWLNRNRYSIVFGSWVASMGAALGIVGRNPYLTGQQKLVQARVYAQGLTLAVVIISLAFETTDQSAGRGRWETVKILDPNDPTHQHMIEKQIHHERYSGEDQWRDMVEAEEQRIKEREEAVKAREMKTGDKKASKSDDKKSGDKKPADTSVKGDPTKGDKAVNAP